MPEHHERLTPAPGYWALAVLAGTFGALTLAPWGITAAVVAGLATTVVVVILFARGAAHVVVADGEFRVGQAHVPVRFVSHVDVLDAAATRRALGPELDARAFVCTRPWVRTSARVHLADPADTTPYWVVATRRPDELAAAITSGAASPDQAHSEQTS